MGGFAGFDQNKVNAEDNRIQAADQALVLRGSGQLGGLQFKNTKGDIIFNDPAGTLALADKFSTSLSDLGKQQQVGLEDALNAQTGIFKDTLGSLATLAESKQTDGASGVNKNIVYVIAGVLFLAGFIVYVWRK